MLVENINTTLTGDNKENEPHDKEWEALEQGTIALVVLFVIIVVLGSLHALYARTSVATETVNVQTIITSAQSLLKGNDGYTFTNSTKMTDALIQVGAVPSGMTVQGDKTSGTVTLYNVWGGAVTITPASTLGFNNGFAVTYDKVPRGTCIQVTTRASKAGLTNGITLNSTVHSDGKATTEETSTQCETDNGSTDTNRLIFTIDGQGVLMSGGTVPLKLVSLILLFSLIPPTRVSYVAPKQTWTNEWDGCFATAGACYQIGRKYTACKRLVRTVLIFTESSD